VPEKATALLSRTTRKVEPTKAGQRLFDAATVALAELRAVVHEFDLAADRGGQSAETTRSRSAWFITAGL